MFGAAGPDVGSFSWPFRSDRPPRKVNAQKEFVKQREGERNHGYMLVIIRSALKVLVNDVTSRTYHASMNCS
ncbi:hypothetical protein C8E95_3406 [Pseudonocardia autotrophica]|nr:hypothetical protein C8E95_3406 [Pseudonocardia autotrophica]